MEIEEMLYDMVMDMFGGPILVGILIFLFFLFLAYACRLKGMGVVMVMFGALIIDFAFIPELRLIVGIGMGLIIGVALLSRFIRR